MDIETQKIKAAIDGYIKQFTQHGIQPKFSTKKDGYLGALNFDAQRVTVEDVIKNENNLVLFVEAGATNESAIAVSLESFNTAIGKSGLTCYFDAGNPGVKPDDLQVVTFESLNSSDESLENIPNNLLRRERSID